MQLTPLPAIIPRQPSSLHILARPLPTDSLYSSRPALCTWNNIFNRSNGETTVRDTAPAIPPAQNAATTGLEMVSRIEKPTPLSTMLGFIMSFCDCYTADEPSRALGGLESLTAAISPTAIWTKVLRKFRVLAVGLDAARSIMETQTSALSA